ncbi:MAG: transcription termination factor Rho [Puniceicoccales bacterium]|jgi:transcription termination factor Rho|nr:transcription termination factor Rho [Puniceicoccales bacterium]
MSKFNMEICENGDLSGAHENFIGILELAEGDRHGQLISCSANGREDSENPYVGMDILRKYQLKRGQKIAAKILRRSDFPNPRVISVDRIDDMLPDERNRCIAFDRLVSEQPHRQIILESAEHSLAARIIDLFCPMGLGQRGIIVSPPRAGKTLLLHEIAKSIANNFPEIILIVALIDERPEEITDFKRSVQAEIYASSNDQGAKNHVRIGRLASERARNLAESGRDVVLFIDSMTRLARAHNVIGGNGRTMTGGIDARAMENARKIFALARDTKGNGSLTVIATVLVDTGSKMDDLIFQELRGTGNLEIILSRKLAEMRTWPAIDLHASGTRHEELLMSPQMLNSVSFLRRAFSNIETEKAMESLIVRLSQYETNRAFLSMIAKSYK